MQIKFLIALFSMTWLTACATATRGTYERVSIESVPPGASAVTNIKSKQSLTFSDGSQSGYVGCAPTPCSINIARTQNPLVTISKAGYETIKFKIVSSWSTGSRSVAQGSIVAGIPPGSHVVAGKADVLKRIPVQGAVIGSGLMTLGMAPLVDIALGSNRSLSPNPVTVYLAPADKGEK